MDKLPQGVFLNQFVVNEDKRGFLTEVYRQEWFPQFNLVQWNLVSTKANVLRGVHVHLQHIDHFTLLTGDIQIGLHDLRKHSQTAGLSCVINLTSLSAKSISIPPGIAHGIWFKSDSLLLSGMDYYWNIEDDVECYWNDPELAIPWDCTQPILSERDAKARTFKELIAYLEKRNLCNTHELV